MSKAPKWWRLASAQGRILMVGHVLGISPSDRAPAAVDPGGELGKVQYIYSNRLSLGKVRREENILWSFAPHDIAVILRLMGSMPFQVVACGGSYVQPNIADVTVTNLLFDNGVRAHIYVSWLHPFKEQRLVVIGSRRWPALTMSPRSWCSTTSVSSGRTASRCRSKGEGQEVAYARDEPLRWSARHSWMQLPPASRRLTDGASGLRVLKVLQAAQRSLVMNGEPVTCR